MLCSSIKSNKNKKNDKPFNNRGYSLNGHLSEASVIDSKYIKMTELQDFYQASSFTDRFQKQPPEVLCKKDILKIYKISREDTCVGVCFKLYLKETPTQVFSSEISEIFMNTYFEE